MEPQVFGNTLYSLRGAAVLAALISVAVSLCVYFVAPFEGTNLERAIESTVFGLGVFAITLAGAIGATLTFHDGTKIRFLGARLEFLRDLCDHLQARCGGRLEIDISAYASRLLVHGGKPRRLPDKSSERTRGK